MKDEFLAISVKTRPALIERIWKRKGKFLAVFTAEGFYQIEKKFLTRIQAEEWLREERRKRDG